MRARRRRCGYEVAVRVVNAHLETHPGAGLTDAKILRLQRLPLC